MGISIKTALVLHKLKRGYSVQQTSIVFAALNDSFNCQHSRQFHENDIKIFGLLTETQMYVKLYKCEA